MTIPAPAWAQCLDSQILTAVSHLSTTIRIRFLSAAQQTALPGRIHQVGVIRDANMHITGFSGTASVYPIAQAAIGLFNDGGVAFGPQNVLFVTRSPVNQVEQSKVGSSAPDKVVDLSPLGVVASTGSIGFVPPGFPGAGSMKIVSFTGGGWYHADFVPDGSGTFDITAASPSREHLLAGLRALLLCRPVRRCFLLTAC